MSRFFMDVAYNGTRFCGWQRQPNGISVQQRLEETMSLILRESITVVGAGRTDAGVHARQMTAHFDVSGDLDDLWTLTEKLNRMLSKDIAVHRIVPVKPDAHARFDALSRTYHYYITDRKNPFEYEWVCRMSLKQMNFDWMNEACKLLLEYNDFSCFSKLHTDVKTRLCRIMKAEWSPDGDRRVFAIQANRFLRNMVRAIVGTLFDVGRGKITPADFREIIETKDRCKAGMSAPAEGLVLMEVEY